MWDDLHDLKHPPEVINSESQYKSIFVDGQEVQINQQLNFHDENLMIAHTNQDDPYVNYNVGPVTPYQKLKEIRMRKQTGNLLLN